MIQLQRLTVSEVDDGVPGNVFRSEVAMTEAEARRELKVLYPRVDVMLWVVPAPRPLDQKTPVVSRGEALARRFHETYERLAPSFGYETRTDTKEFDPTTPNGRLMIAVCEEITR